MRTSAYKDFMQSEPWRGRETRFGYSEAGLAQALSGLSDLLLSEAIEPRQIAEYGCGTALHLIDVSRCYPNAAVWGFEPAGNMFEFAIANVLSSKLENIQVLRFSVEDIPDIFKGYLDLTFSILVGSFADDLKSYLQNIYKLASPQSLHFFFELMTLNDMSSNELKAATDFFYEIIEIKRLPGTLDDILNMASDVGFKKHFVASDSDRLSMDKAKEIHAMKDPRRAAKEEAICLRHGLDPAFLSSIKFGRQFSLIKS